MVSGAPNSCPAALSLDLLNESGKAIYVSIPYLRFDPRLPAARDVAAYQKHRVKHIRRGTG